MTGDLCELAAALGSTATLPSRPITGWSTDSRTVSPGDLFFALKGPAHDGHQYVAEVLAKGAVGAVVSDPVTADGSLLYVPDTLHALHEAARWARAHYAGTVVGVTGSAGKTTTKDVIAALLATAYLVGKTTGNYNNHVGLPLSLLRLPVDSRIAVLELGMNHAGEIRDLARIAQPAIGVVTNVGYAHIENFESIAGIAAAKRELIEALPAGGTAVLNADDPLVAAMHTAHAGRTLTFGLSEQADVRAENVSYTGEGVRFTVDGVPFESAMLGRPAVLNILAGLAVAGQFGLEPAALVDSVRALQPGKMRGERLVHNGVVLWNDCYNANPEAMQAMLEVLRDAPAVHRIAVLGEMRELGHAAAKLHRDVGRFAAQAGLWAVVGVSGAAREIVDGAVEAGLPAERANFFEQPEEAGRFVKSLAESGDAILWKGSRGTRVEKALEAFLG